MIGETNPTGNAAITVPAANRGFLDEPVRSSHEPLASRPSVIYPLVTHFWRGVISGTLLVMSLFIVSYLLMLGCHVGVTAVGVQLGTGAAIWMIVTSAIAFFIAAAMATALALPLGMRQMATSNTPDPSTVGVCSGIKGASVWALTLVLGACLGGSIGGINGLFPQLYLPRLNIPDNLTAPITGVVYPGVPFGFIWASLILLVCGLVFAIIGSMVGDRMMREFTQAK